MTSMLVHVIYTPGTVDALSPFAETLVRHSTARFRLVANACGDDEVATLRRLASRHADRVEVVDLGVAAMIGHGRALDRLLADLPAGEETFVFLDSDIFASGPVDLELLRPRDGEAGRCSALPLWHHLADRFVPAGHRTLAGRHLVLPDGSTVACTYAGSYRTDVLRATCDRWGVSLRTYQADEVPGPVADLLAERGRVYDFYDTGKVVSLLTQLDGLPTPHVDIDHLVHVGALSGPRHPRRRFHKARLAVELALSPREGLRAVRERIPGSVRRQERESIADLMRRRDQACRFVDALAAGERRPPVPAWCPPDAVDELVRLVGRSS